MTPLGMIALLLGVIAWLMLCQFVIYIIDRITTGNTPNREGIKNDHR